MTSVFFTNNPPESDSQTRKSSESPQSKWQKQELHSQGYEKHSNVPK